MADIKVENQGRQTAEPRGSISGALTRASEREGWVNPFSLMRRLSDELDRAFSSSFGLPTWGRTGTDESTAWMPAVEVRERDHNLVISAELPGMNKEDVHVEVSNEGLVIQGERKRESEERGHGYYRSERSYGRFHRTVPIPEGIDADKAKAQFKDGLLQIELPLPESLLRKRREIPVK